MRFARLITPLLIMISISAAKAVAGLQVDVKCRKDGSPAVSCGLPLNACTEVKSGMIDRLKEHFDTKIKFYYRGIDMDFEKSKNEVDVTGSAFPGPVCNLLRDGGEERKTNREGAPCGTSVNVYRDDKNVVISSRDGAGTRETGYMRGTWIQTLRCYEREVIQEIENGKIHVSSACEAIGKDLNVLFTETESFLIGQKAAQTGDSCSVKVIDETACGSGPSSPSPSTKTDNVDSGEMRGCYLAALRTTISTGAINQLAACEVYTRADQAFTNLFRTASAHSKFQAELTEKVVNPCEKAARNKCDNIVTALIGPLRALCMMPLIKVCYDVAFPDFFKQYVAPTLPNGGNCPIKNNLKSNDFSFPKPLDPMFAGAALSLFPGAMRRKRRKKWLARARKWKIAAIASVLAITLLLGAAGCSKTQIIYANYCHGKDGLLITNPSTASKCCKSPELIERNADYPSDCPQPPELGLAYNAEQAATAINLARAALKSVKSLDGGDKSSGTVEASPSITPSPPPPPSTQKSTTPNGVSEINF